MRKLSSRGITYANRGASGGYSLVKSPEQTIIGEIVRALEDDMEIIECVVGKGTCKCCPSRSVWNKLYRGINQILDEITLKQMIEGDVK